MTINIPHRLPLSLLLLAMAAALLWGAPPAIGALPPGDAAATQTLEKGVGPQREVREIAQQVRLSDGEEGIYQDSEAVPQPVPLDPWMYFPLIEVSTEGIREVEDGREEASDDSRLIYSNTLGINAIDFYRSNQPVSDDIATTAPDGCNLKMFKFKVLGKVTSNTTCSGGSRNGLSCTNDAGCPGGGTCIIQQGPFTVQYALYSTCPLSVGPTNSTAYLRELVKIPGTSGEISFPDDTPRTIKHVVDPHNPVAIPANLYLGLQFNRGNCGTVLGAPAMVGFSGDVFDFPNFPCYGFLGGFPDFPHASFWLEMYGDANCPAAFPGYKNAQASGPIATLGANVQGVDDIKLQVENCQMVGYEVAVKGVGFYTFDLRRQCDGQVIAGTERTFQISASTTPLLQIARYTFDPPIPLLDDDLFFGFRSSSNTSGAVIAGKVPPIIGESSVEFFTTGLDGCQPVYPGTGVNGAMNLAITCAGELPVGACCDMVLMRCLGGPDDGKMCACNFVCKGATGVGGCCNWNSQCATGSYCEPFCASPGTCEPICREVPKMNCPRSWKMFAHPEDMWVEGATCSSDPFVPACGVAACCKTDDTCENLTESQCMATGSREDIVLWWETTYCESPGLECLINICRDPEKTGDCSLAREDPGCSGYTGYIKEGTSLISCCREVCREDSWCCDVAWDRQCVQRASELCVLRPSFDSCFDASELRGPLQISVNSTTYFSNIGATESTNDPGFCCNASEPDAPGFGTVWLKFVASHESVQISTCGSDSEGDSLISLFAVGNSTSEQTACNSLSLIGCGDDGCGSNGRHSKLCADGLTPGKTYYVLLASKEEYAKGLYQIQVQSPCQYLTPFPQGDCNQNGALDGCDLAAGTSLDCNGNLSPDECDLAGDLEPDCNENAVPDSCDIETGYSSDCQLDGVPDECEVAGGFDCDEDGVPDNCGQMRAALRVPGSTPSFAVAVATDGEWLFVGDSRNSHQDYVPGVAHVYRQVDHHWTYVQQLSAAAQQAGDLFGSAIEFENGRVYIGAPGSVCWGCSYPGAVYTFTFDGNELVEGETLRPFNTSSPFLFGWKLSADGDSVAVSGVDEVDEYSHTGLVFTFSHRNGAFVPEARLAGKEANFSWDYFGSAIKLADDTLFIGAPREVYSYPTHYGSVHVFVRNSGPWSFLQKLFSSDAGHLYFGQTLGSDGNELLVGAYREEDGPPACSGAVIAFHRDHITWNSGQVITACDGATRGFGTAIDVSGSDAVIGFDNADLPWAGLARTYHLSGGEWSETSTLLDPEITSSDSRRIDVELAGDVVVTGTSTPDYPILPHPATAYVFALPLRDCNENDLSDACEANLISGTDCNANGTPDVCEPRQFADSDFSGRLDLQDYACLQRCFSGSGGGLAVCCGIFDSGDTDGDADLVDFVAFQREMNGP